MVLVCYMSLEVKIGAQCVHMILEEPVSISSDRRSISLKAPVSSAGSVRILANNAVYIPPGGLGSQAVLTGASPGPFKILRCTEAAGPDGNVIKINDVNPLPRPVDEVPLVAIAVDQDIFLRLE